MERSPARLALSALALCALLAGGVVRTGVLNPTPDDVLDGDLGPFIAAALALRMTGEKVAMEDAD